MNWVAIQWMPDACSSTQVKHYPISRTMRFLTFIKQSPEPSDPDLAAFKKWYLASKMGKQNPHAGVPQIKVFTHLNNPPEAVIMGFYKWLDAYQKQDR